MYLLYQIRKLFVKHLVSLKWYSLLLIIGIYFAFSWLLLWWCGEKALMTGSNFFYWIVVTASTVGYGDFSPETVAGKYVDAFFVIPFGLALFGLIIGRLIAFISFQWHKGIEGLKSLHYKNHILVIGWNNLNSSHKCITQ